MQNQPPKPNLTRMAVIGNYVPRQCGIATFTTDLAESLAAQAPGSEVWAVAMNDMPEGYEYPSRVRFELNEKSRKDYSAAADFLNLNGVEVVCLQHEYGIFGGQAGDYILDLLDRLRMPVVTTLHTVLREPSPEQLRVIKELARISAKLVVMSHRAVDFLRDIYQVSEEKIAFVHHGIPDLPFVDPNYYKDQFGVHGRTVAATFGLISPNKGIENMIAALPEIVQKHPDFVYLVLGTTHPNVKRHEGERYRTSLKQMAADLGVTQHVQFLDRFADIEELCEFLGCADVYVTPYSGEAQITSGTLAYAMGSGKAVVSTPYWYAAEMLAEERGVLVPFGDAQALAQGILGLLEDPARRHAIRKKAYLFTRDAVWKNVAQQYLGLFAEAKDSVPIHRLRRRASRFVQAKASSLPEIALEHLKRMTDDTGLLQHCKFNVPDRRHGYCTDDNARALVFTLSAQDLLPLDEALAALSTRYLGFLTHAFNPHTGRFRNLMSFDREWQDSVGSEDCHARALWALGMGTADSFDQGRALLAATLFQQALPAVTDFRSPRGWAVALLGIDAYRRRFVGDSEAKRMAELLAGRLLGAFKRNATGQWFWPEDILTYDNGKLAEALIVTGAAMANREMLDVGLRALEWLTEVQTEEGRFVPVGNNGWYERNGRRARFDQQPIEAEAMIGAYASAYRITGDDRWAELAERTMQWFLGQNDLGQAVCDSQTGACYDGLQPDGLNLNQGAESTLAWLISLAHLHRLHVSRFAEPFWPAAEGAGHDRIAIRRPNGRRAHVAVRRAGGLTGDAQEAGRHVEEAAGKVEEAAATHGDRSSEEPANGC